MSLNFSGTQTDIQKVSGLIDNVVNQYIVRPAGGNPTIGVGGFVFDIIDDEEISLDSDITDHYVEDNTAIQDHITHRPERFTLRGYVGEMTDIFPNTAISILQGAASLGNIGGFAPGFTMQATQVYTKIADVTSKVGNVLNQAQNLFDLVQQKGTSNNKQQQAFNAFYSFWSTSQILTVETPFTNFENMVIESVRARQQGKTRFVSDFSVTFKKLRFATTKTVLTAESKARLYKSLPVSGTLGGDVMGGITPTLQKARVADANAATAYKGSVDGQSIKDRVKINVNILDVYAPGTR